MKNVHDACKNYRFCWYYSQVKQQLSKQLPDSFKYQLAGNKLFAKYTDNQLGHVKDIVKVIVPSVRQWGTADEDIKIQTQKGSNERLFILTRTHSMQISEEIPLSSHKTTLKQQING